MVRDINPFSIDSFAEHTRAAGHGQWMDDYRPVEITGQKPSKEMRCGPGNKQAIMICKNGTWIVRVSLRTFEMNLRYAGSSGFVGEPSE